MKQYVNLKLFATLAHLTPSNSTNIPINQETTVKDLMESIGVRPKNIKLIFINGILKQINSKLTNGDKIGIFPPVGGG